MDNKIKVLIIDHNHEAAASLGRFLLINGLIVGIPAFCYDMTLDILNNNRPDIVLMDINLLGNEYEAIKIANHIDAFYHLPMIFMSNNEQLLKSFKPSHNRIAINVSTENPHYHAHVLVAIDNIFKTVNSSLSQLLDLDVVKNPILTNGEPKHLNYDQLIYKSMIVDSCNIAFLQANNTDDRNTSLLWLHNNHEFCLREIISLRKLVLRHTAIPLMRISKKIIVNTLMIESFQLHHFIIIDGHELVIGRHYKKMVDQFLLSLPGLNNN